MEWEKKARIGQLPPKGDWDIWLLLAGRGYGKTRAASEEIMNLIFLKKVFKVGIIANSNIDIRNILIPYMYEIFKNIKS